MKPSESLTIVAVPEANDITWKLSSEKVPHMTILFLGDQSKNPNVGRIEEFVRHAASQINKFGLSVGSRGLLGDHDADVLFFDDLMTDGLKRFRSHLLQNDDIKAAYDSVEQYPQWTPHLTMGYPETPAKPDTREYPGIGWVNFDRLALWTDDSEGPEFPLKSYSGEVSLSMGEQEVEDVLAHFGVLGMKWGVRRGESGGGPQAVTVTQRKPGGRLKAKGGKGHGADNDAVGAVAAARKAKKSGVHSLSNQELQKLVQRMNLEQQYVGLKEKEPNALRNGMAAIKKVLGLGKTLNEVHSFVNSPVGKEINGLLKKRK